jgi:hypothetical protein
MAFAAFAPFSSCLVATHSFFRPNAVLPLGDCRSDEHKVAVGRYFSVFSELSGLRSPNYLLQLQAALIQFHPAQSKK